MLKSKVLIVSLLFTFSFIIFGLINPTLLEYLISLIENFFKTQFGWFYLLVATGLLVFLLFLAFSRYGKIKLGDPDDKPEFSNFVWFSFLFSAGTGIGLVFYGVAEPISHFTTPPISGLSEPETASTAMSYSFFHYGLHAWAIFGTVALAFAYFKYRKKTSGLVSGMFYPILGNRVNGPIGTIIDIIVVIATIFGVATTFGMGTTQIGAGISYIFEDVNNTIGLQALIVITMTFFFLLTVLTGLKKGMKYISVINITLSIVFVLFVFIMSNPTFIMNVMMTGTGQYLQNIVNMSFFSGVFNADSATWILDWPVFYWAWYISWAPFVGLFIARVSRGRTIKEFVIGVIIAPTIWGIIWFSVFGGAGLYQELFVGTAISDLIAAEGIEVALFALLESYPFTLLASLLGITLLFTYFISSADSATLVLSMQTSNGSMSPSYRLKLFWGVTLSSITLLLLWVGGMSALQSAMISLAFPVVILMVLMMVSLYKVLKSEFDEIPSESKVENTVAKPENLAEPKENKLPGNLDYDVSLKKSKITSSVNTNNPPKDVSLGKPNLETK